MSSADNKPYRTFFETLGNRARWEIINLLENGEMAATEIARELSLEQSLTSHHLRRLGACGFVRAKKDGRMRVYSLNAKTIRPLMKLVHAHIHMYCANGRCALC